MLPDAIEAPPHDGSSQAARLRPELDPAFAPLDERSLADLLAFARAFAAGLVYVDEAGVPRGDWQGLFPPPDGLVEAADHLRTPGRLGPARAAAHARPHFALLLAILDLLGLAREQLNGLTARHLDHFYRQVLRLQARPAVPDQVHLLVQPDDRHPRLMLPAGTVVLGGKDAAGQLRRYRTTADLAASTVQVAALCSVRTHIRTTGIAQASRQYLTTGTRAQAFLAMLRIALGFPQPGDPLPVPLLPGLPAQATGAPLAEVDFDTLVQAHDIVDFVGTGLGLPLYDEFRQLMQLRRLRIEGDAGDWATINAVLLLVGQRRDASYQHPGGPDDDFHARLQAALGLDSPAYAALYNQLPEVASLEDVFARLGRDKGAQAFVAERLRLTVPEFNQLMQTKLRVDGQWHEILRLLEGAGRRLNPRLVLTADQRALRSVDALLATTHGRPAWPHPLANDLAALHQAFVGIERYVGMSAEAFHFMMSVARRGQHRPNTVRANTPADDADWDRVHALCAQAHQVVVVRRRCDALLQAAMGLPHPWVPGDVMGAMLAPALGMVTGLESAWSRLAGLGVGAADLAWLQALASGPPGAASMLDWQRAAEMLEVAQRNREGGTIPAPEQRVWHHAYPVADARLVSPANRRPGDGAPRWQPFGNLVAAARHLPAAMPVLGWALASPLLALSEGRRKVQLTLGFDGDAAHFDVRALQQLLAPADARPLVAGFNPFDVQLSGPEGWITPDETRLGWLSPSMDGYPAVPGIDTRGLRVLSLACGLAEPQPAVVPPTLGLHGLASPHPVLRLMLRPAWHEGFNCHHSAYQALAMLQLRRLALQVRVEGLASLSLQNDQAVLDPKKPFEPFGLQPVSGARLSIGHPELVGKALDSISFNGRWMGTPASMLAHYRNYPGPLSAASFTVSVGLRDGLRLSNTTLPLGLFGSDEPPVVLALTPGPVADPGRLLADPPVSLPVGEWRRCWVWELAGDLQHAVYPPLAIKLSTQLAAAMAPGTPVGAKPVAENFTVNPPYTPKLKGLTVDYSASVEQPAVAPADLAEAACVHHVMPFGHQPLDAADGWEPGAALPLLPPAQAQGELFIGLAGVQAPQRLSLLVQVAEGSADPDAPAEPVAWSVLSGNQWLSLQSGPLEGSLIADGTRGLVNPGIVELQLPAVQAGSPMALAPLLDGKAAPAGSLYWLRLQRQRGIEGVGDLVALHPHAVLARRDGAAEAGDDLALALPPGQITAPAEPVPGLAALQQPYSSFGGRPAEAGAHFNTRVSERLRHRQRALTPWDIEHLALEAFPQLYKAKCLRADAARALQPGSIDLIVVPDITQRHPFDPFAPKASAELIQQIHDHLADKLPAAARLRVRNAVFVPVKVRCGVRFMPGTDEGWCRQQLNQDLNRFLSPWAHEQGADLVIGGSLYANTLINFIEQRPYVDFIAGLRMFTGELGRFTLVPDSPEHRATAHRPDAVLVAAAAHEFDVIAATDYRVQGFAGIGAMRIELDFSIA